MASGSSLAGIVAFGTPLGAIFPLSGSEDRWRRAEISWRYERKSLIITCNQPFSEWNQVFPDPAVTVAAIDRPVHHSTILEINTESYRRRTAAESSAAANKARAKLPA